MGTEYCQFQKDVGWRSCKIPLRCRLCKWFGTCPIPQAWGTLTALSRLRWYVKYMGELCSLWGGG